MAVLYFLIEFSESDKEVVFRAEWNIPMLLRCSRWLQEENFALKRCALPTKLGWKTCCGHLSSFGLSWTCSGTREDTLSWEYEDQCLLTTLFPVNKSHRQFYDSWKIDDPEPRPWNRQLQNSCRPHDEKRFNGIFIELMLVVNLYIFCNGVESFSKNKKKHSICNLFYHFLKGFLDKIELW